MSRASRRLPLETPAAALTGYKLAHLVLAMDGGAVAFAGMSVGSNTVYGPVAEATCVYNPK